VSPSWQLASQIVPGAAAGDDLLFGRKQDLDLREQIQIRARPLKGRFALLFRRMTRDPQKRTTGRANP